MICVVAGSFREAESILRDSELRKREALVFVARP
jgi:hypothetical protein